jgi:hypothetical protein
MAAPTWTDSTTSQISIAWEEPSSDGGCAVTGYAVFRDDGAGSSINTEINSASDAAIRDNASLFDVDVTYFPASMEGETFFFQVYAFNAIGSVASESASFILGQKPSKPTTAPVKDAANSDNSQITVDLTLFSGDSETGAIQPTSYNLEVDDGTGSGVFTELYGETSESLLLSYTYHSVV